MVYLLTPTRARFKDDVAIRAKVLDEIIGGRYPVGFEVVLIGGPEGDMRFQDEICENLDKFSSDEGFYISVHAPLERNDYTKKHTDLTTEQGLETLTRVLELSKKIGARLVNVHSENFHSGRDLLQNNITCKEKYELQCHTAKGILQAKASAGFAGIITIENMPYPLMGNDEQFSSIQDMPYDPVINTADDIIFFSKGIGICIDTCHYGITQRIINEIAGQNMSPQEMKQRGILGIPREDIRSQPSLSELAFQLGDSLKYVHLADYKGVWVPGDAVFVENVVPGEGDDETELRSFVKLISNKQIPMNLEIGDKDFKELKESRKAMKYLLDLLSE